MGYRWSARRGGELARGVGFAVAGLLAAAGCRQLASIDDAPTPPDLPLEAGRGAPVAPTCGVTFGGVGCATCMATSCCAEEQHCAAAADCAALAGCVAACASSDVACPPACRAKFPNGDGPELAALQTCEARSCGTACSGGATCGGYVLPSAACASCAAAANCCSSALACTENLECSLLAACERQTRSMSACAGQSGASCVQQCELEHPSGVSLERAFGSCLSASCQATCFESPAWACLAHPVVPPAPTAAVSLTYFFSDYLTGSGIPGLTARACRATTASESCSVPFDTEVTGSNGEVVLHPGGSPFLGYTEISGPGYGPILLYVPPVTNDFVTDFLGTASQSTLESLLSKVITPNPALGTLLVRALDCAGAPAEGVHLAIDGEKNLQPVYFAGGVLAPTASATSAAGGPATAGYAAFGNVPTGFSLVVRATAPNGLAYPEPLPVVTRGNTMGYTEVLLYAAPP